MAVIGSRVMVLRHPDMADIRKQSPASYRTTIAVVVFLAILGIGIEAFAMPGIVHKLLAQDWKDLRRSDLDALAIVVIPLLMLPFLPGLRKAEVRQKSQRLLVGELGLQMTEQAETGLPAQTSRPLLWKDVKQARLVYRRVDGMKVGVRIATNDGQQLFLSALRWTSDDANHGRLLILGRNSLTLGLARDKYAMLVDSDLVKTLTAQGLSIQDEPKYLSDKIAVIIGLSLAGAAAVWALIYVSTH